MRKQVNIAFSAVIAVGLSWGLLSAVASDDFNKTSITLIDEIEWDNKQYLKMRMEKEPATSEWFSGKLETTASDFPTIQTVSGIRLFTFAGVTLEQFHSFAQLKHKTGTCTQIVASNYPVVTCVISR